MTTEMYTQLIDFLYTSLLMIWGGSCISIGFFVVPLIFKVVKSTDDASQLTAVIFKKQDVMIRTVAVLMIGIFYYKSKLDYSYQHIEWVAYVCVLHFFIFGKIISRKLWKLKKSIATFNTPADGDPKRISFGRWHNAARVLYVLQALGVIALLYLHAFGL